MNKVVRVVWIFVLVLLVVLVTPSAFAQSWVSAVAATTTTTTAAINWTSAVPATSQVIYGITTSYGSSNVLNPSFTTSHSSNLVSLTAGTSYHYRVLSVDASGVLVTSLDCTLATAPAPVSVSVSPTTATVVSAGTQQFSALIMNTSNTAVTWSATAGAVSTTGLFTAPTVSANKTVTITATSVADTTKSASASVTVTASVIGILTLNPTSISFGSVTVGQTSPILTTTLTNTGKAALTITSDSISTGDFNWGGKGTCNYSTLLPGASCLYSAKFTPTATGNRSGIITINSTASNSTVNLPLSGIGTSVTAGTLAVSPTTMVLGSVVVGTSGTASGSLTANGANVTVSAVSSNNSAFSIGGLSLPIAIPAGQSAAFTVTFSPQTAGAETAALTFTSNSQPSTTVETINGTGTPAPVHSVNLSWNASTSPNISGYNVYRAVDGTSCGSYSKINSALNTTTLYTDFSVVDGTYYCYATTSVNSSNEESGYSNVVSNVHVPAP